MREAGSDNSCCEKTGEEVTYTEDVVKGDTTSSVLKDATVETGLVVKVPAFIKVGDVISIDTQTGEYRERKK
jgi:elongation factor P